MYLIEPSFEPKLWVQKVYKPICKPNPSLALRSEPLPKFWWKWSKVSADVWKKAFKK